MPIVLNRGKVADIMLHHAQTLNCMSCAADAYAKRVKKGRSMTQAELLRFSRDLRAAAELADQISIAIESTPVR